jgi:predicted outer membrane protein
LAYRAEKVANHRIAERKLAAKFFDIAKSRATTLTRSKSKENQLYASQISKGKEIFRKMPGTTEENATVAIVDPTSATGEEIDASVDRDRIRVVCTTVRVAEYLY